MSAPQVPNYGIICKSCAAVDSIIGAKAQKSLIMFKNDHLCPVPRVSLDRVLDRLRAPVREGHEVGSPGPAALPPLLVAELGGDAAGALGRRALFYWTISGVAVLCATSYQDGVVVARVVFDRGPVDAVAEGVRGEVGVDGTVKNHFSVSQLLRNKINPNCSHDGSS